MEIRRILFPIKKVFISIFNNNLIGMALSWNNMLKGVKFILIVDPTKFDN